MPNTTGEIYKLTSSFFNLFFLATIHFLHHLIHIQRNPPIQLSTLALYLAAPHTKDSLLGTTTVPTSSQLSPDTITMSPPTADVASMPILTKQSEQAQLEEVQKNQKQESNDLSAVAVPKDGVASFPAPPKFTDPYEERAYLKARLVLAYRLFAKWGFDEGVAGHITIRVRRQDPRHDEKVANRRTGSRRTNILLGQPLRRRLATSPIQRPPPCERQRRCRRGWRG